MNKRVLFFMIEFYLLDEFVKKRTSVENNTYFYVEDKDGDAYLSYAYYSKNDKTLYLYLSAFTDGSRIKPFTKQIQNFNITNSFIT